MGKHVLQQGHVSPRVPLANNKSKAMTTTITAIPLHFPFFFASNLAALYHTRRHHHEQWEKSMEMGKMERGEESQLFFGEEWQGSTKTCPSFPSLLLFSSSPSPFSFLDLLMTKGSAGREDGLGFRKGRGYCSTVSLQCGVTVVWAARLATWKIYNFLIRTPNASCK